MTRQPELKRLMRGVGQDMQDYRRLKALLEQQFDMALRHRAATLAELAAAIMELVEALERRRQERVALVAELAGPDASFADVLRLLQGEAHAALESGWRMLEALVGECKQLNARNGRLMTDQYAIMQRVRFGEEQTYAPA